MPELEPLPDDADPAYRQREAELIAAAGRAIAEAPRLHRGLIRVGWKERFRDIFWPASRSPRARLYEAFDMAVFSARGKGRGLWERPWTIVIGLARDLAEDEGYAAAALVVLAGLLCHEDRTAPRPVAPEIRAEIRRICDRLNEEERTETRGWRRARTAAMASRLVDACDILDQPSKWRNAARSWLRAVVRRGRRWRRIRRWSILLSLVGAVAAMEAAETPPESWPDEIADLLAGRPERRPPPAEDRVLSRAELRYCLFESRRLGIVRATLLDRDVVGAFDRTVGGFNARCGSFRRRESDYRAVREEAARRSTRWAAEAAERVAGWRARSPRRTVPADPVATGLTRLDPAVPEHAKLIQRRLRALGFYGLAIDGAWGAGSRAALRAFKRDRGMRPSATWDLATQRRLFRAAGAEEDSD